MKVFQFKFPTMVVDKASGERVMFDPASNADHRRKLDENIDQWRRQHPEAHDAQLDSIDMDAHVAVLIDHGVTSVNREGSQQIVNLRPADQKPAAGERIARIWEARLGTHLGGASGHEDGPLRTVRGACGVRGVGQGPGVGPWDPGERVGGQTLGGDGRTARRWRLALPVGAHDHLAAVEDGGQDAGGVRTDRPCGLDVHGGRERADGGWRCRLARTIIWQPSKMAARTQEACEQIGHVGWTYTADAKTGIIDIIPGEPPVFLKTHPFPFDRLGSPADRDRTPFGVKLPARGGADVVYEPVEMDWRESSFLLIGGEGGSGKSVLANNLLASIVAQQPLLSVVDLANKATDYYWLRPWVTAGYWGCESVVQAAGVLNMLVDEIEHGERARAWKENAWQNWLDIPRWAKEKYPLHYIVVDEYSSLVDEAQLVKRIPKADSVLPAVWAQMFTGQAENDIRSRVLRLLRTARAQGYRLILISQTVNERSGLGPTTRDLFGQRIVMGPNPSEALVRGVFHDVASMPVVPEHLTALGVTKGVGRAEFTGQASVVFKTTYAGTQDRSDTYMLAQALVDRIGVPDGVDAARFLRTLEPHGEDDPVDAEYMRWLTDRVSMPYARALATDPVLSAIKGAWDESRIALGGEDDPVDAEYMRWLTDRVSMPYARALATDPVLSAIKGAWDESRIALGERPDPIPGMGADTDGADAGDGDADGDGGAGLPAASPDADSQPSGPVMDAHELARLMRA